MDKANWSPEEAVQLARELNNFGTHYRNAVASLYNTFSNVLSNYWRGKNYNVVAEYVNEHYDEFDLITNFMCITAPSVIQNIAALQAENGLGSVSVFNYEINDPSGVDSAVSFNLIPMTEESSDGNILLTQDIVEKYIDGNGEPSLLFYQERMEEYMNSYNTTLDQFSGIKEFNDALQSTFETIETFKTYSSETVKNIIEETKLRADAELGKISEADANTKDLAVKTLSNTSTNSTTKGSSSMNPNSGSHFSNSTVSRNSPSTSTTNNSNEKNNYTTSKTTTTTTTSPNETYTTSKSTTTTSKSTTTTTTPSNEAYTTSKSTTTTTSPNEAYTTSKSTATTTTTTSPDNQKTTVVPEYNSNETETQVKK